MEGFDKDKKAETWEELGRLTKKYRRDIDGLREGRRKSNPDNKFPVGKKDIQEISIVDFKKDVVDEILVGVQKTRFENMLDREAGDIRANKNKTKEIVETEEGVILALCSFNENTNWIETMKRKAVAYALLSGDLRDKDGKIPKYYSSFFALFLFVNDDSNSEVFNSAIG